MPVKALKVKSTRWYRLFIDPSVMLGFFVATNSKNTSKILQHSYIIYMFTQSVYRKKNIMERTYIKNLKDHIGKEVVIKGFIHSIRNQGGIKFLQLRDITGLVQIVVLKSEIDVFNMVPDLTLESVVSIKGLAKEEKQAPSGIEVQALALEILSKAEILPIPVMVEKGAEDVDITKKFDWRWLDLRRADNKKIFSVWTQLEKGFREYFYENNFLQVYMPSLMSTASESGSEVFKVEYFDRNAYLAQSPQFFKQMAMASDFDRVFVTGPVFRAEPSYTTRHVTEFTGWDFEASYIDSHEDLMAMEEQMIIKGFERVKEVYDVVVPTAPFPKMTMVEAKQKLKELNVSSEKEHDLSPEEERAIAAYIKETFDHDFLFVTDWHKSVRPFYHMRHDENPDLTKSFDLLYKGLEITTGAQREHRVEVLQKQALDKGMNLEDLEDYINFFKYGCPPHGGCGIGPARIIMKILDLASVKEAIFLPRDVKRLRP